MRLIKVGASLILAFLLIYSQCPYLHADEIGDLKAEVAALKDRLIALESRLQEKEAGPVTAEKPSIETGIPQAITAIAKGIEVHGYVDTSYTFNTNTPVAPNPRTNNLRLFDNDANGFLLNMAQLSLEKPVSKDSPIGFRVKLDAGNDAKFIHANGLGNAGDEFDLEEAFAQLYVPLTLPFMNDLKIYAGKYVTMHGAEVIESPYNWNFSRSFLFTYAIPFTHTGVKVYWKPFENIPVDGYIGIVNGWDNAVDNNRGKSVEAEINYYPTDKLAFTINGMFGPERFDSNNDFRNLIDIVVSYQATDKLALKANYDYGWEKNGAMYLPSSGDTATATGLDDKDASWQGLAVYAKYDIYDWWSLAARAEYFYDAQGVRTGVFVNNGGIDHLGLFEYTFTSEFKVFKNMIARLEYRYDKASDQVFFKDKTTANNQSTLMAEIIYKF